jgi:TonB family protein
MQPSYVGAALMMLAGTHVTCANADNAPGAFRFQPCDSSMPDHLKGLSSEELAASNARFMKLCTESSGPLINGNDPRISHRLTRPRSLIGRGLHEFYPRDMQIHGQQATLFISYVLEIDGRPTSPAIVKSSGRSQFDDAALKWISNIVFKPPAQLDSMPVRMYAVMRVNFRLGQ